MNSLLTPLRYPCHDAVEVLADELGDNGLLDVERRQPRTDIHLQVVPSCLRLIGGAVPEHCR